MDGEGGNVTAIADVGDYVIQQSVDLKTWSDIHPVTVGVSGEGSVDDSGGPSNMPVLFYRGRRAPWKGERPAVLAGRLKSSNPGPPRYFVGSFLASKAPGGALAFNSFRTSWVTSGRPETCMKTGTWVISAAVFSTTL